MICQYTNYKAHPYQEQIFERDGIRRLYNIIAYNNDNRLMQYIKWVDGLIAI